MSSVAVKNPETSSPGALDRLRVGVLGGVLYVLGSLAVLLELLPWLWWGPLGFQRLTPTGNVNAGALALLVLVGIAVAGGLAYLGARLLGPHPTPGVKAGIFTALVALLFIALLTRWASLYIEAWVYDGKIPESLGIILTVAVGVLLLVLAGRFFFLAPSFGPRMVAFEEQGWFGTTSYKRSQGRLVRRGTIVAVLALAGTGIYSLEAHKTLAGAGDWTLGIPFTGTSDIKTLNDGRVLYGDKRPSREVEVSLADRIGDSPVGISKESRPELDTDGNAVGVIVTSVAPDSPAANAKIRDGDTITRVDGTPVGDVDKLRAVLEDAKKEGKETVKLTVLAGSGFQVDQTTFRDQQRAEDQLPQDHRPGVVRPGAGPGRQQGEVRGGAQSGWQGAGRQGAGLQDAGPGHRDRRLRHDTHLAAREAQPAVPAGGRGAVAGLARRQRAVVRRLPDRHRGGAEQGVVDHAAAANPGHHRGAGDRPAVHHLPVRGGRGLGSDPQLEGHRRAEVAREGAGSAEA
jgi:membrane-associated protease RseP (regulator of RpoE activity)